MPTGEEKETPKTSPTVVTEEIVAFVVRTSVCTLNAGATAQRAGLAVVQDSTAYEAPPLLPKEVRDASHRPLDPIPRDVRRCPRYAAAEEADVVVVSWHWESRLTGGVVGLPNGNGPRRGGRQHRSSRRPPPPFVRPIEVYKGKVTLSLSLTTFTMDRHSGKKTRHHPGALPHPTGKNQ